MSRIAKKLTVGLLMAATTFTAGSTCFANQVGFFNDGTGCETAKCYRDLTREMNHASFLLMEKKHGKVLLEDDLMKKYYPEVFEKIELAQKSLQGSANAEEFRQNLEKMYSAAAQYCQEIESYKNNINEENCLEISERAIADNSIHEKMIESFWKAKYENNNVKEQASALSYEFDHKLWKNCAFEHHIPAFFDYIEAEKAIYDYYKQTAAELGFDTSNHKKLIAQLKECDNDSECRNTKFTIELPTNQYLAAKQDIGITAAPVKRSNEDERTKLIEPGIIDEKAPQAAQNQSLLILL